MNITIAAILRRVLGRDLASLTHTRFRVNRSAHLHQSLDAVLHTASHSHLIIPSHTRPSTLAYVDGDGDVDGDVDGDNPEVRPREALIPAACSTRSYEGDGAVRMKNTTLAS